MDTINRLIPDIKSYKAFLNRELSWLEFNIRIIEESKNSKNPLLEKMLFLSIAYENLDQFFMVRVAGLNEKLNKGNNEISPDGLTPSEQLQLIYEKTNYIIIKRYKYLKNIRKELKTHGVEIISRNKVTSEEKDSLKKYFLENIKPLLNPYNIDRNKPFPSLPNLSIAIILSRTNTLKNKSDNSNLTIITLPEKLKRLIAINNNPGKFILLEDIIYLFKKELFSNDKINSFNIFRITRNSFLKIEKDPEDLLTELKNAIKKRNEGNIIRLETDNKIPEEIITFLKKQMNLDSNQIFKENSLPGLNYIKEIYSAVNIRNLKYKNYIPRFPQRINDYGGDCFEAIKAKDLVIHHPYESFDVVLKFLRQAAQDPCVTSIKQTLYRTSSNSPVIKALMKAAKSGKSVTVVVELKARFDEKANLKWANNLKKAGAKVIFGIKNLKTHAKVCLITRKEGNELRSYAHFGTGNYHSIIAKTYSDLSFFTSDKALCEDASYIFSYITKKSFLPKFNKISMSPISIRQNLISLINSEINNAKKREPANIWLKINSLVDSEIIEKLYEASCAGVNIDLIVRGLCSLKPGIKGLSENIRVKNIIGRFLEHSRIFCFGNGNMLPSQNAKIFISSADWMSRNLDRRVEVMVPIENETIKFQIMEQIMIANLKDKKNSWYLNKNGSYTRYKNKGEKEPFCAFNYFMNNRSLSGRGKSLKTDEIQKQREKILKLFNSTD